LRLLFGTLPKPQTHKQKATFHHCVYNGPSLFYNMRHVWAFLLAL
jgi:hypothetical protein